MGDLRDGDSLGEWMEETPPKRPISETVTIEELEKLRRAHKVLGEIHDIAFEAVERGRIFEPTDVSMIALAAKIVQQAGWGLGK